MAGERFFPAWRAESVEKYITAIIASDMSIATISFADASPPAQSLFFAESWVGRSRSGISRIPILSVSRCKTFRWRRKLKEHVLKVVSMVPGQCADVVKGAGDEQRTAIDNADVISKLFGDVEGVS